MNWLSRLLAGRANPELDISLRVRLEHYAGRPERDLALSHFETRYVVVNTEASGLDVDKDPLLAVAAIAVEGGAIHPARALYAPLGEQPGEALAGLLEFIDRCPVVLFNSAFNQTHLERAFDQYLGLSLDLTWIDLHWLLPVFFPEFHSAPARLAEWMTDFAIETFQRHHALGDGYAIAQLLLATLGRSLAQGLTNPRALIETERSRRWLRQVV
jgi:DNA polymerase III subunit epsilon